MKHKSRALAILLALAMVLTLMPAMAFAASVTTKYPAKIEYKGNTFYTPAGVDGDDFFDGYWKEGNEIIITYNDNTQETFVSKEYSNGFNYFRKGDEAKDENIVYDFRCAIKSPGIFTVDCGFEYNYQNEDGIIIPGQRTVSTEVEGVCIKSFEYTGGPKIEYEMDQDTGEIWGSGYEEGAVITINYNKGPSRNAVCRKWGTNKDSDGKPFDEYAYFLEGVTPDVQKDSDGRNYAANAEHFTFEWEKATTYEVPVEYNGVVQKFPISKKVYPKPKKVEFVPAKGFTATAYVGDQYFDAESLYGKGNKLVITWDNDTKTEYVYSKYKEDGEWHEGFANRNEDENSWTLYNPDFEDVTFTKGNNTITGEIMVWADGYGKDFRRTFKVNVKCTKYVAYAEFKKYTYTGKVINPKPVVLVANDNGKMVRLKSSRYTFKAPKSKAIGQYEANIKLKNKSDRNKYGSTIIYRYQIVPKTPSKVKVKAGSKNMTVTWSKQKDVDGYYIEYASNKRFRDSKTSKKLSSKTTKHVIKNLKKGKTYYVSVYAIKKGYSTWTDGKGRKHKEKVYFWSNPSATKSAKVK